MTPDKYLQLQLHRALPHLYPPPFEVTNSASHDKRADDDEYGLPVGGKTPRKQARGKRVAGRSDWVPGDQKGPDGPNENGAEV